MRQVNLFECEFAYDESDPDGYRAGAVRLSQDLEAQELALNAPGSPRLPSTPTATRSESGQDGRRTM